MKAFEHARKKHLLVVEDDAADQMLIRRALSGSVNVESITVTEDGEEALAFLQRRGKYEQATRPDLIIMDFNLPKADAVEIVENIRASKEFGPIPIVIFSTTESPRDISRAYAAGVNGFMVKPADLDSFFNCLSALDQFWLNCATLPSSSS